MSLPRFFINHDLDISKRAVTFELDENEYHHLQVRRIRPGEHIAVVDGSHCCFEVVVTSIDGKSVTGDVVASLSHRPLPDVTLFQGISKGDRMDLTVRATTELGVARIVPLITDRVVVRFSTDADRRHKEQRWSRIALESSKQAGRDIAPQIDAITTLTDAVAQLGDFDRVIVAWEEQEHAPLAWVLDHGSLLAADPRIALFIGPEGGLATDEVDMLVAAGAHVVSLGETILRTETAAIVASALVIYEMGGLGNS